MDNLGFLGSILGGAIAALLGFVAALMVETWRHRKRKVAIVRAIHREIKHNNSIIQVWFNLDGEAVPIPRHLLSVCRPFFIRRYGSQG